MEVKKEEIKILIVDDAAESIDYIGRILLGYKKSIATSGKKALEKLFSDVQFDIVLLDYVMSDMDGLEVCRRIKSDSRTKDIPVIFVTSKSDYDDEDAAYDVGAADYIIKPFNPRSLLEKIKTQIILKKALEQLR